MSRSTLRSFPRVLSYIKNVRGANATLKRTFPDFLDISRAGRAVLSPVSRISYFIPLSDKIAFRNPGRLAIPIHSGNKSFVQFIQIHFAAPARLDFVTDYYLFQYCLTLNVRLDAR